MVKRDLGQSGRGESDHQRDCGVAAECYVDGRQEQAFRGNIHGVDPDHTPRLDALRGGVGNLSVGATSEDGAVVDVGTDADGESAARRLRSLD